MVQTLQKKLSESKTARWTVLALISFTMLCGYFISDVMAPLKPLLESQMGWSSSDYGFFTSGYGWFNVFLLMLIAGGIILDKMGVRFTGILATGVMIAGAGLKYWAVSTDFAGATIQLFGTPISSQVLWAAIGYAIFGVGVETAGITVSKIIVKWFKGKELALAMGLEMACARIGTGLALGITPILATYFGSISMPILMGVLLLCIGLLAFTVFVVMDRRYDREVQYTENPEDAFSFWDIAKIFRNRGFWYIALLCVIFYSAVFPFLKYAPDLMYNKFGVSEKWSGIIPALLPFGTILLTPFFGNLYDRKGKGATIMLIGAGMITVIHAIFSIPILNHWTLALGLVLALGVAFSLVPSAMWPSVPKIIPEHQLGTAYAVIFWIQNCGLMGMPYLIGKVLDKYCIVETGNAVTSRVAYDYTPVMVIFAVLGALSIVVALLLRKEDARKNYGLEKPNIRS